MYYGFLIELLLLVVVDKGSFLFLPCDILVLQSHPHETIDGYILQVLLEIICAQFLYPSL